MLSALFVLVVLVETVFTCSCPPQTESTNDTVQSYLEDIFYDHHRRSKDIYTGTVVEATCKCFLPASAGKYEWQCLSFSTDDSVSRYAVNEERRYKCENQFMYMLSKMHLGRFDCDNVFDMALGDNNYNTRNASSEVDSVSSCRFRGVHSNEEKCNGMSMQPCSYKIKVKEVFKGNHEIGELIHTDGPKALVRCGGTIMLEVGQTYMMGIGSFCSKYHQEWSKESDFTDDEIEILRYLKN